MKQFVSSSSSLNRVVQPFDEILKVNECDTTSGLFLDLLKRPQEQENSSLQKITRKSSKKLKVAAKFEKRAIIIDPNRG